MQSLLNYVFPRNTVYGMLQCVYGFHSGISGTPLFSAAQVLGTLMLFTMVPALSRAVFNQMTPLSLLRMSPDYYKRNRVSRLSWRRFVTVRVFAACASALLLETSCAVMRDVRRPYGDSFSHAQFAFAVESSFVVCCISFVVPTCHTWTRWHHTLVWRSVVAYFIVTRAESDSSGAGQGRGSASSIASIPVYWLMLFLYSGVSVFCTISYILFRRLPIKCQRRPDSGELLDDGEHGADEPGLIWGA
jgi:magnesium-transporting ATPase (P-type)